MKFKEGDRVYISGGGRGTIVKFQGRIYDTGKFFVRIDNFRHYNDGFTKERDLDCHCINEENLRKLTKLDKALK